MNTGAEGPGRYSDETAESLGLTTQISYRDYLIWTAAHTAHALTESIRVAIDMQGDEIFAIEHLEHALAVGRELLKVGGTTDRVAPRPRS